MKFEILDRKMVFVPMSAGPLILVLIGRTDMFPTRRTSGSSLNDE